MKWLANQPGGPAKVLVISEEWSSDCRRDVPMLARLAEAGGLDLRIFTRDGRTFSRSQNPSLAEAPDSNADIMAEFLNVKDGQTWQSIPVAVFYTKGLGYLYHYVEYPAIYHKDRLVNEHIRAVRPGETPEQTRERGDREFSALQQSPFFHIWACAGVDEILSALHERLTLGSLPDPGRRRRDAADDPDGLRSWRGSMRCWAGVSRTCSRWISSPSTAWCCSGRRSGDVTVSPMPRWRRS